MNPGLSSDMYNVPVAGRQGTIVQPNERIVSQQISSCVKLFLIRSLDHQVIDLK